MAKLTERSLKGKGDGAKRGIVRFWKGWCGAGGYCSFAMVVGMARVGATGGASPSPYEKTNVIVQFLSRISTHRHSPYEKQGIVRFWKGCEDGEGWCNDPSVLRQIGLNRY